MMGGMAGGSAGGNDGGLEGGRAGGSAGGQHTFWCLSEGSQTAKSTQNHRHPETITYVLKSGH